VKRVILDTDPGIDDALALLLALRSPELEVAAITTVSGNVPVDTATANVFKVLSLVPEVAVPVARGADGPLIKERVHAGSIHGPDGLGGQGESLEENTAQKAWLSQRTGPEEIVRQIESSQDPVTIIALGPLTNLALALEASPRALASVERCIVMGGAISVPGNITPAAEFNLFVDPHAASRVFQSGLPLTLVGLDVTRQALLQRSTVEALISPKKTPIAAFIARATERLLDWTEECSGEAAIPLHDPLAVAVACDPGLVRTERLSVEVETEGELARGMSIADLRPLLPAWKKEPNLQVCLQLQVAEFMTFFLERVL
jgi:purine nucleosidase/pyrimidine-specific ribonucleoside hydrolase